MFLLGSELVYRAPERNLVGRSTDYWEHPGHSTPMNKGTCSHSTQRNVQLKTDMLYDDDLCPSTDGIIFRLLTTYLATKARSMLEYSDFHPSKSYAVALFRTPKRGNQDISRKAAEYGGNHLRGGGLNPAGG